MKIIFSPSKGMKFREVKKIENSCEILFSEKSEKLVEILQGFSKEKMGEVMKIKGELLERTYENYKNYKNLEKYRAIELYSGVSFSNLEPHNYSAENFEYMRGHLRILSALYGILTPESLIREYRLDMTMRVGDFSLYNYWKEAIEKSFEPGELVINLASGEFSKMLDRKKYQMVDIEFRQKDGDKLKNISTEAKKMRGQLLDFMIKNRIISTEEIENFSTAGYSYSKELSDGSKLFFVKSEFEN